MKSNYIFEWLDVLVTITLNPSKTDFPLVPQQQIDLLDKTIATQKQTWKTLFKSEIYAVKNQEQMQLLLRRYHSDFIVLLDQAHENYIVSSQHPTSLHPVVGVIVNILEELLAFIEGRYGKFLALDQRVPVTYLERSKEEIRKGLDRLKKKLFDRLTDKILKGIVYDTLYRFTDGFQRPVTFGEVIYYKDLVKDLDEISSLKSETDLYKSLNEVLVYRNFNKKAYLNYFTGRIARKVNMLQTAQDRLDQLLLSNKEFNQMLRKPGVALNPHYTDIEKVVGNWFSNEIGYLQSRYPWEVTPLPAYQLSEKEHEAKKTKTKLDLNTDQIALLLRALVDTKTVAFTSVNEVFKMVTPFLSSKKKEDISWNSMRRSTYAAEDRDKHAATAVLEKMILVIKNY
ncbi:hypothetical protein [Dyadobacter frigoris]|uniref:Uncharacterized protein n=1 Tax=Dyadobacter frigoris TaxID=2576211 RepID=A0A4U6CME2_9BACT|nr:hypothetical protein [Dyadobacter frigoris]TKT85489.1 hypothetical protein FDK13_33780 [Dyadobacter frigoris]GLU56234.1 hypothetical protein Dfri01_56950 [Dyadobacter frigoris]